MPDPLAMGLDFPLLMVTGIDALFPDDTTDLNKIRGLFPFAAYNAIRNYVSPSKSFWRKPGAPNAYGWSDTLRMVEHVSKEYAFLDDGADDTYGDADTGAQDDWFSSLMKGVQDDPYAYFRVPTLEPGESKALAACPIWERQRLEKLSVLPIPSMADTIVDVDDMIKNNTYVAKINATKTIKCNPSVHISF